MQFEGEVEVEVRCGDSFLRLVEPAGGRTGENRAIKWGRCNFEVLLRHFDWIEYSFGLFVRSCITDYSGNAGIFCFFFNGVSVKQTCRCICLLRAFLSCSVVIDTDRLTVSMACLNDGHNGNVLHVIQTMGSTSKYE